MMRVRYLFLLFSTISTIAQSSAECNLINIATQYPDLLLSIRYATNNNCVQEPVYSCSRCYLQKDVARALHEAQQELAACYSLKIMIFDGYQPKSARQKIWDLFPNVEFIANPMCQDEDDHARGCAVDVTLATMQGDPIDMGTDFDCLTVKSKRSCTMLGQEVLERRILLDEIMKKHGFVASADESWWHYVYANASQYPMLDVEFEDLD